MVLKEECGICGISSTDRAELKIFKMLIQLQHRGQLSAGITAYKPNDSLLLKTHKDLGLVNNVFRAENKTKFNTIMDSLKSTKAIGHTRYATFGTDNKDYAQPFERTHGKRSKWFSICFNGNITNYEQLKSNIERQGYHMIRDSDTEIIMHLISKSLRENEGLELKQVLEKALTKVDGSYCLAYINAEGTLAALRDPLGIKPLSFAEKDGEMAFASESVALHSIGFHNIHELEPGHILIHENNATRIERFIASNKKAHCFFEWIYFAHPASKLEGKLVYDVRRELGRQLAKNETEAIDENSVVVAVPDSSMPAAIGFSEELDLPLREGLIRNRYVGRTFIESEDRAARVKDKFIVLRDMFFGKKVFLVEDSIVRGTTLKSLISYIRKAGSPKEIHVRVSCPPIMWPCFYGIDMGSKKGLIAKSDNSIEKTVEAVKELVGVDSIKYQTFDALIKSIGLPENDLCTACLTGKYPTSVGQQMSLFNGEGRAYETTKKIVEE